MSPSGLLLLLSDYNSESLLSLQSSGHPFIAHYFFIWHQPIGKGKTGLETSKAPVTIVVNQLCPV